MIPKELIKKIRLIDIRTRKAVNDVFAGEYHSVFKGRGMEFSEVREYMPGDDVRTIDWNVTARMGAPYVKIFEEERELTVMLLVDVSSSGEFGTANQLKREIALEICAMLAFSAEEIMIMSVFLCLRSGREVYSSKKVSACSSYHKRILVLNQETVKRI
jgi:uncharacterized protein (DUF58 family)